MKPLFEPNMDLSIFHPYHIQCNDCCGLCCVAYDCFGAGQKVSRLISKKLDWNSIPPKEKDMIFNLYLTVMQIHQTQWYLTQASILNLDKSEKEAIRAFIMRTLSIDTKRMSRKS